MKLSIPNDARMEIKFAGYQTTEPSLQSWLNRHPAGFTQPFPDRQVNNVYFDTYGYEAFNQNLSGASARIKLRYRWYGSSREPSKGTLEVKCKRNFFGWKLRYHYPEMALGSDDDWRRFRQLLREGAPVENKFWLNSYPQPIMINRYHRQYFLSADGKIRITIDTGQSVWDQRVKPRPNYLHEANLPKTLVLETKFDRHDGPLASRVLQGLPIRVSRHSKYINGLRAISGY